MGFGISDLFSGLGNVVASGASALGNVLSSGGAQAATMPFTSGQSDFTGSGVDSPTGSPAPANIASAAATGADPSIVDDPSGQGAQNQQNQQQQQDQTQTPAPPAAPAQVADNIQQRSQGDQGWGFGAQRGFPGAAPTAGTTQGQPAQLMGQGGQQLGSPDWIPQTRDPGFTSRYGDTSMAQAGPQATQLAQAGMAGLSAGAYPEATGPSAAPTPAPAVAAAPTGGGGGGGGADTTATPAATPAAATTDTGGGATGPTGAPANAPYTYGTGAGGTQNRHQQQQNPLNQLLRQLVGPHNLGPLLMALMYGGAFGGRHGWGGRGGWRGRGSPGGPYGRGDITRGLTRGPWGGGGIPWGGRGMGGGGLESILPMLAAMQQQQQGQGGGGGPQGGPQGGPSGTGEPNPFPASANPPATPAGPASTIAATPSGLPPGASTAGLPIQPGQSAVGSAPVQPPDTGAAGPGPAGAAEGQPAAVTGQPAAAAPGAAAAGAGGAAPQAALTPDQQTQVNQAAATNTPLARVMSYQGGPSPAQAGWTQAQFTAQTSPIGNGIAPDQNMIQQTRLAGTDTPPTPGFSGYLRNERSPYGEEMARDPLMRAAVAAMIATEHASDPVGPVESLMNRAAMSRASLRQRIFGPSFHRSFYGPVRTGAVMSLMRQYQRNGIPPQFNRAIDTALSGSNILGGATDQGSGRDPNVGWRGGRVIRNREIYNDWGGYSGQRGVDARTFAAQWRRRQQEAVRRELQQQTNI